jgi:aspartate/methionine/tyrosine aminotransferase
MEITGPDAIDLGSGTPRFDVVPSGSTKLPADRRGFPPPWGLTELREAVAAKLQANQQLTASSADEILITHGVAGGLSAVLEAFVNTGDRVVLFDPTSPLYVFQLRYRRARLRWIGTWMENGRLRFHLEPLVKALRGARLILLNSPANPTGGYLAAEDLEQIAWWAQRRDVLIWSDEVYDVYRYEGDQIGIGTLARARNRTLSAGSLSSSHGLASARVGWLAGHRHLVRACVLSAGLQTPGVPTLCQQQALAALRLGNDPLHKLQAEFASRRRYAFERLEAMGLKPAWPAGAFFFWIPVGSLGLNGLDFARRLLSEKKVLVVPGNWFGPSGNHHIRLSYAADEGRLREGLSRLAEFIRAGRTVAECTLKPAA